MTTLMPVMVVMVMTMRGKHTQVTRNEHVKVPQRLQLTVACSVLLCNPPLGRLGESRG